MKTTSELKQALEILGLHPEGFSSSEVNVIPVEKITLDQLDQLAEKGWWDHRRMDPHNIDELRELMATRPHLSLHGHISLRDVGNTTLWVDGINNHSEDKDDIIDFLLSCHDCSDFNTHRNWWND